MLSFAFCIAERRIKVKKVKKIAKKIDKTVKKLAEINDHLDQIDGNITNYEKLMTGTPVGDDPKYKNATADVKAKIAAMQQNVSSKLETHVDKMIDKISQTKEKADALNEDVAKIKDAQKLANALHEFTKAKTAAKAAKSVVKLTKAVGKLAPKDDTSKQSDLANICVTSLTESLSPPFCWKKGADVGVIPTGCPKGYFRYLALCFQNCEPGTSFDGGLLCIGGCPGGYRTDPLTCYRWWTPSIVGRRTYAPHSITNFEAPCQEGYYRGGALCYRDCSQLGMVNCGIGMCAADSETCASGITSMVVDTITGLGKAVGFVMSFGASSAASEGLTAAKTALKTASSAIKKASKSATTVLKRIATDPKARKKLLDKAKEKVKEKIKEKIKEKGKDAVMGGDDDTKATDVCAQVHTGLLDKMAKEEHQGFDINTSLDIIGLGDIGESCSHNSDSNAKVGCAKSILDAMANVDPTGLCGIAAAFMQPTCDV
jgi:hypothetical protein